MAWAATPPPGPLHDLPMTQANDGPGGPRRNRRCGPGRVARRCRRPGASRTDSRAGNWSMRAGQAQQEAGLSHKEGRRIFPPAFLQVCWSVAFAKGTRTNHRDDALQVIHRGELDGDATLPPADVDPDPGLKVVGQAIREVAEA